MIALAAGAVIWWRSYHAFDSATWKAVGKNPNCFNKRRQRMVGDLKAHHVRVGMTTRDVRLTLGPPSYKAAHEWGWFTGLNYSDCTEFDLRIDNGRVVAIE
jgi:hypothetical protein